MSELMILLVRAYQATLSKMLPSTCRFIPSCSEYSILAYRKCGFFRGTFKTVFRILRCNPFCRGGEDMP